MWDPSSDVEDVRVDVRLAAPRRGDPRAAVRRVRRRVWAAGRSTASPTPPGRAASSTGSARACSAAAPTTGAASRCASAPTTSGGKSLDGLGDDWPISYDDLKPYYDRVDELVGIFGSKSRACPTSPTASSCRRRKPRCYELLIKQAADRLKITCIPARLSILTQPHNGRTACHYCGQCGRGCAIHANFSSPSVLIPPALATKKLTIVTNAMAREVTIDETGLATGVAYIDKNTGRENHVRARIVVLAASACESARILLNSKSSTLPAGPRQLQRHRRQVPDRHDRRQRAAASFPKLMNGVPHNEDGVGGMHLYMPWWLDNKKLDFPRGYHIELGGGRGMPSFGFMGNVHNHVRAAAALGATKPRRLRQGAQGRLPALLRRDGRLLRPRRDDPEQGQLLEIDPSVVDRWGIPVLRFHFKWTTTRSIRRKHMQETFRAIIEEMGGTPLPPMPTRERSYGLAPGGRIIHELGVTRMGNDAEHVGAQQELPGARLPQPVRRRRRPVRDAAPTRTARGRSWRCRCGRASSSSASGRRGGL